MYYIIYLILGCHADIPHFTVRKIDFIYYPASQYKGYSRFKRWQNCFIFLTAVHGSLGFYNAAEKMDFYVLSEE